MSYGAKWSWGVKFEGFGCVMEKNGGREQNQEDSEELGSKMELVSKI